MAGVDRAEVVKGEEAPASPNLVIASRNPAKADVLAGLVGDLVRVRSLPVALAADADGEEEPSLEMVAAAKARRASAALPGGLVVATDGGLLVPALDSAWDPRLTRRFAGPRASDRVRADALLALTGGLTGERRRIGWREAMAVAHDGAVVAAWTAEDAPGFLAPGYDPRLIAAVGGFWISSLWICPEHGGRRLAELTTEERAARNDHWSQLGTELRRFLATAEAVGVQ